MSGWIVEYDAQLAGRVLRWLVGLLVLVGVLALGWAWTPRDERGLPLLLTPERAALAAYQRRLDGWQSELREIAAGLEALLSHAEWDLFEQDRQLNLLQGRLARLQQELEATPAPPGLERSRQVCLAAQAALQVTLQQATGWVGEPQPARLDLAREALEQAQAALETLASLPRVGP